MIKKPIPTRWVILLGILSVILMLVAYSFLSHRQHQKSPGDTTIPNWNQLTAGVHQSVEVNPRSGERWIIVDAKSTATRLFLGLFIAILGAIVIGFLMGCFGFVEALLVPPLSLLAKIPPTAALAVFFVLVGTNMKMFAAMIAFGVLPILAQTVYLSIRAVPNEMLYKGYTLGASHVEVVWNIIFRIILPDLIDAVRLQIGPAMVYLIAAEMVCADVGFGYRIRLQSRLLNMSVVYPYLGMLAAFGFAMDYGLRFLQRLCCPWYVSRGKT